MVCLPGKFASIMTVSNLEREGVVKGISSGIRFDNRSFEAYRDISFEFSSENRGNVTVYLGQTRVQTIVTAILDRPFLDRPFEGQLSFYVEYSSAALNMEGFSAVGTRMDEEQLGSSIQRTLERAFKSSRAVDMESLCIVTGQRVWNIRVDIHILEDDGNVLDAVMLSTLAALTDFRRPDVQVSAEQEVTIFSAFERHPVPLSLHHFPLSVTFGIYKSLNDNMIFLADPTNLETLSQETFITFIMNRQGEIVHMIKPGGIYISSEFFLEETLPIAKKISIILSDLVSAAVGSRPAVAV